MRADSPYVDLVDPSPNYGERRGVTKPSFLILHYTGMETGDAALERLKDPVYQVSAHYLIYETGKILQLVPEAKRAHHAGISAWQEITDLNSHSIGIELVNPGHEFGYCDFPDPQMRALITLGQDILARTSIPAHHILGHSDIAPLRKQDPGEKFDWPRLAAAGIGLFPPQHTKLSDESPLSDKEIDLLAEKLWSFGYRWQKKSEISHIFLAFQRHFCPKRTGKKPSLVEFNTIKSLIENI